MKKVEVPPLTPDELKSKFAEVTALGIADQCKYFLREFVVEFSGQFQEVLDLSEEFKGYAPEGGKDDVRELDQAQAHLFLEKRGETMTATALRDALKDIDLDSNSKVSFIEYCLFNYKKSLQELFEEKPGNLADLIAKLDAAIDLHEEVQERRRSDEAEMKKLEALAGGSGVKAAKAKVELEGMRARSHTGQNMAEVRAAFKKRQAEKALAKGDPMAEEMERLKLEQKAAEDDLKLKQELSRKRLAERAAAFG